MEKTITLGDLTNPQEVLRLAQHLQTLYRKSSSIPILTADPNGSVSGKDGDMVRADIGTNHYLYINVGGGTVWKKATLS